MPRAAKISTARGLSSSAMSTFGIRKLQENNTSTQRTQRLRRGRRGRILLLRVLCEPFAFSASNFFLGRFCGAALFFPGPVEPGQQRLDVAALDGGAGPDADARRRGA